MKPLIKWPGGKSRELNWIKSALPPNFTEKTLYVEPFLGGGALFFYLTPKHAILNDLDIELISFYKMIKKQDSQFFQYLHSRQRDWTYTKKISTKLSREYIEQITLLRSKITSEQKSQAEGSSSSIVKQIDMTEFEVNEKKLLLDFIKREVTRKLRHTLKMESKTGTIYDTENHIKALETALKAGYYYYMRHLYNKVRTSDRSKSTPAHLTNFYFVREFCFGSMFRFNSKNEYNIPYGGMDYNNKDFLKKIKLLQHPSTKKIMKTASLYNLDFNSLFEQIFDKIPTNSFVFLDPPYDSDFTDYSGNSFTSRDHKRLSQMFDSLSQQDIPTMLIIAETPLILDLYSGKNYNILKFAKNYTYNVRGRNDRTSSHVIITNYGLSNEQWSQELLDHQRWFDNKRIVTSE